MAPEGGLALEAPQGRGDGRNRGAGMLTRRLVVALVVVSVVYLLLGWAL